LGAKTITSTNDMTRLITSIRVDHGPAHDLVHVFVQGALTGVLASTPARVTRSRPRCWA
jgi:hypothetical protein